MAARSGRVYIIRFPEHINLESKFHLAQPGSLGMCLYTYTVNNLNSYLELVESSVVKKITSIAANEFCEISFSFVAPDRYFCTLMED